MTYLPERALALLRVGCGNSGAHFRDGQDEAIRHVVEGRGRLLVVQKTGWGKSFVYFIATKLLREAGHGPALLVSPLLALMRNQIAAAERMGVRAASITSDNRNHWRDVEAKLLHGEVDILLISPERLANAYFVSRVLSRIAAQVSLLVIDEAHCISDWGHDFRPDYRRIERIVGTLPANLRVLATTATAPTRVIEDLADVLGPNISISRGDLSRPSLSLQTISLESQAERLAWISDQIGSLPGSGIIYALTKRDTETVANWLKAKGVRAEAYNSDSPERDDLEAALMVNDLKALVATSALGMGYDKPDLGFVIHYQMPSSVVAYYQQVGRAGRAIQQAYGIMLTGKEDSSINQWFIESAFPTREEVDLVLKALESTPGGLTLNGLMCCLNIKRDRILNALKLLSLESPAPIVKDSDIYQLTAATLSEQFWTRTDRLTRRRHFELLQMQEYAQLEHGAHMPYLIRMLDGDASQAPAPSLAALSRATSSETVKEATAFLRLNSLTIKPRVKWPPGGMPKYRVIDTYIPSRLRAQAGRALCAWSDTEWGDIVRRDMSAGAISPELVHACATMVREWRAFEEPQWVTCIPSLRRPALVSKLAQDLAAELRLPFRAVLLKTDARPEQKSMSNSVQQARNLDGALEITDSAISSGPVLLVDDVVNSGWTLTVAAWLLRRAGSGNVFPLALSHAGSGG